MNWALLARAWIWPPTAAALASDDVFWTWVAPYLERYAGLPPLEPLTYSSSRASHLACGVVGELELRKELGEVWLAFAGEEWQEFIATPPAHRWLPKGR